MKRVRTGDGNIEVTLCHGIRLIICLFIAFVANINFFSIISTFFLSIFSLELSLSPSFALSILLSLSYSRFLFNFLDSSWESFSVALALLLLLLLYGQIDILGHCWRKRWQLLCNRKFLIDCIGLERWPERDDSITLLQSSSIISFSCLLFV